MQTRHRIALLTAGFLVGAQISVASIGTPIADTSEQMEPVPGEALAEETGTPGEPTESLTEAPGAPAESVQSLIAAAEGPNLPLRQTVPQGTAFPDSPDEAPLLPAQIAYFDRTEHLRLTGASGNVFPASIDESPLLPATVAYLERREASRLAAQAQPQIAGEEAPATGTSLAATSQTEVTTPGAQEPARDDINGVDTLSPPSVGNPL